MSNEAALRDRVGTLGLIVGGGDLPLAVAKNAKTMQIPVHYIQLDGISNPDPYCTMGEGNYFSLGSLGKIIKSLRDANCRSVCFAGRIDRPDFKRLKIDTYGLKLLPSILVAASKGDDSLLRKFIKIFEKEGFQVIGPQEIASNTLGEIGLQNKIIPSEENLQDMQQAKEVARMIGHMDIGQGAVVCNGLVLAVEAQEGTDEMLRRCALLSENIRGSKNNPAGVLVKFPKPDQEQRVDLPTLGVRTVTLAIEAGLAGIGYAAGKSFLMQRELMCSLADKNGLFLIGLDSQNKDKS